jgi:hypothetical protein
MQPKSALRSEAEQCLAAHLLKAADALQLAAAVRWSGQQPQGRDFVCLQRHSQVLDLDLVTAVVKPPSGITGSDLRKRLLHRLKESFVGARS